MNWDQFKTIVWLRWRLSRNQFGRGGQLNAVLSVLLTVMLLFGSVGLAAGGLALGFFVAAEAPAPALLLIWDGVVFLFLIFWLTGLMVEVLGFGVTAPKPGNAAPCPA